LLREKYVFRLYLFADTSDIKMGEIVTTLGWLDGLPIALDFQIDNWIVFYASFESSKLENDWWINPKAAVAMLK
jgi:uncharacterized protein (UPF0303 family)